MSFHWPGSHGTPLSTLGAVKCDMFTALLFCPVLDDVFLPFSFQRRTLVFYAHSNKYVLRAASLRKVHGTRVSTMCACLKCRPFGHVAALLLCGCVCCSFVSIFLLPCFTHFTHR